MLRVLIFLEGEQMKIIYKDGTVGECPQEEELHVLRHTAAHVMAQAIKSLFPEADLPSVRLRRTAFTMTWISGTPN